MLKIVALSDIHGELINVNEEADMFVICGDISPLDIQRNTRDMFHWMLYKFGPWVDSLPYKSEDGICVLIAGNHDFTFERGFKTDFGIFSKHIIYLDNCGFTMPKDGKLYRVFGCPYCRELRGWAFCKDDSRLPFYYDFIPDGLDLLILHDAPDIMNAGVATEYNNNNFGNKILGKYVKHKKPRLTLFGHIHTSPIKEETEFQDGCKMCNVSILDEDYLIRYKPKVFVLD